MKQDRSTEGKSLPARRRSPGRTAMLVGVLIAGLIVLAAVLAAILPGQVVSLAGAPGPNSVDHQALNAFGQPSGPSGAHLLGVDAAGRDVVSRLVYAARVALVVGFVSTALALLIGALAGLALSRGGRGGGRALFHLTEGWLGIPLLLFGVALASACSGAGGCAAGAVKPGIAALIAAIGLTLWPFPARLVGGALADRTQPAQLLRRLAALASRLVPAAILYEAALSFLGLGAGQGTPSWGAMIAGATPNFSGAWWAFLFPGLALLVTVMSLGVLGRLLRRGEPPRPRGLSPAARARPHPFLRFSVRRVLQSIALLVLIGLLVYVVFGNLPARHAVHESLGTYLRRLFLHADLGHSLRTGRAITGLILARAPVSAFLLAGGIVLWVLLALAGSTLSALRTRRLIDRTLTAAAAVLAAAPVFWLGLIGVYLFASDVGRVRLLPGQGAYDQAATFGARAQALVLPWIVIALGGAALYLRQMRARLLGVMGEDYILTARLTGLSEMTIVLGHGLRSTVSALSGQAGRSLGSAAVGAVLLVEPVFGVPGVGSLVHDAIAAGDLRVVRGLVLFGALVLVLVRLAGDLVHAWMDPREVLR